LLERAKQVVEGAGAASVAAILSDDLDVTGETVMPLLCGGNLDMTMMRTLLVYALSDRKQLIRLQVRINDSPGTMAELSGIVGSHGANIHNVRHDRSVRDLTVGEAFLEFNIETAGEKQAASIVDEIEAAGYTVEDISQPQ